MTTYSATVGRPDSDSCAQACVRDSKILQQIFHRDVNDLIQGAKMPDLQTAYGASAWQVPQRIYEGVGM